MSAKKTCRGEFTQFVSNKVFSNIHWHPCFSVVHRNGVSDHLGNNRRTAGVRLDHLLVARLARLYNSLVQFLLNKRTLFIDLDTS